MEAVTCGYSANALQKQMENPLLSAVIIAFNEERNIKRCLESIQGIADEVVVVDSGSTDATVAICASFAVRIITHDFEGHIEQKNWAAGQAHGRWILSLDADEALGEELRTALFHWKAGMNGDASSEDGAPSAFAFNRLTNYCGSWIRHGGWYPDRKIRLWKRSVGRWAGENPHDRFQVNTGVCVERLKGDLLHYSYYTLSDHLRQIDYFSDIAAVSFAGRKWGSLGPLLVVKVAFQWLKTYIVLSGWKDGLAGWTIARWSAFATWQKYRKIRKIQRARSRLERAGRQRIERVLICRTDAIGDVVATLPLVGWLKKSRPDMHVGFLTRKYTQSVPLACQDVDEVVVWEAGCESKLSNYDAAIVAFPDSDVARALRRAGIPIRVGTGRRFPTSMFLTDRAWESRKKSGHHEVWHGLQLINRLKLFPGWAEPKLRMPKTPEDWFACVRMRPESWQQVTATIPQTSAWLVPGSRHVILHPGSHGSANNWSEIRYTQALHALLNRGVRVLITGTPSEAQHMKELRETSHPDVVNATGQLDLQQLMALISEVDGIIASSTGPLHLAGALGVSGVGLYGAKPPVWPERWHPLGPNMRWIATDMTDDMGGLEITVDRVLQALSEAGGLD